MGISLLFYYERLPFIVASAKIWDISSEYKGDLGGYEERAYW